jgi:hypothetical protein
LGIENRKPNFILFSFQAGNNYPKKANKNFILFLIF